MRDEHVLYATEIGRLALVARLTVGRALVGSWADGLQQARVMSDPSEVCPPEWWELSTAPDLR